MSFKWDFYLKRRLKQKNHVYHLSGGLQPKICFIGKSNEKVEMITTTSSHYMMGGTYLWKQAGVMKREETGSMIPYFSEGIPLSISQTFPFHGNPDILVQYNNNMLTIIRRKNELEFEEDEMLSGKFGVNTLDIGMPQIKACKIEIRDLNNNGLPDIIIGENDWSEYFPRVMVDGKVRITRWSDQYYIPFDDDGNWRGGRLNGRVYFIQNLGEDPEDPDFFLFKEPVPLENVNQYGFCAPVFADFTGDGLEDMICGDFINNITFFKRKGTRDGIPEFEKGIPLLNQDGSVRKMRGVINYFVEKDITGNGLMDLVVGSENGHVTLLENLGELSKNGAPLFASDYWFLQENAPAKSDVLAVPAIGELRSGKKDVIVGNAGGFFTYFQDYPQMKPVGDISTIPRVLPPYPRGSIQGPSEIGWGYTCPTLFDWNGNGLLDLVFSDINGEHQVSLNVGDKKEPQFKAPFKIKIEVAGKKKPLVTTWRVKPTLTRLDDDLVTYVCLDSAGILSEYRKIGDDEVELKGKIKCTTGGEIRLTKPHGGGNGRAKLAFVDWNGNGVLDILVSVPKGHDFRQIKGNEDATYFPGATVALMINKGSNKEIYLTPPRYLVHSELGKPLFFGHHSCAVEPFHDHDGNLLILVGAEDGCIYEFKKEEFVSL
ncbi:MAG: hypothetical protein ACTSVI_05930 [Promethearchaeota archaeon]